MITEKMWGQRDQAGNKAGEGTLSPPQPEHTGNAAQGFRDSSTAPGCSSDPQRFPSHPEVTPVPLDPSGSGSEPRSAIPTQR